MVSETPQDHREALALDTARLPTGRGSLAKRFLSPVHRFSARLQDKHLGDIPAYVPYILRLLGSDPSLPSWLHVNAHTRQPNQQKLIAAFVQATLLCQVEFDNRSSNFRYSQC